MNPRKLAAIALAAAALIPMAPATAYEWRSCYFNGVREDCSLAGGRLNFTITYRSDGKELEFDSVGVVEECNGYPCGAAHLVETKENRFTRATYWVTRKGLHFKSERGNKYFIPGIFF